MAQCNMYYILKINKHLNFNFSFLVKFWPFFYFRSVLYSLVALIGSFLHLSLFSSFIIFPACISTEETSNEEDNLNTSCDEESSSLFILIRLLNFFIFFGVSILLCWDKLKDLDQVRVASKFHDSKNNKEVYADGSNHRTVKPTDSVKGTHFYYLINYNILTN